MKNWIILVICIITGFALWVLFKMDFDDQSLGKEYYYLPAYEAKDIGYPGGAIIYKSLQKYSFNDIKVEGEVVQVKKDDKYITALRKPIADSSNLSIAEYYIINKEIDKVYGPYDKIKYIEVSKEIGVSDKLRLE